jgi:hypothetical protein
MSIKEPNVLVVDKGIFKTLLGFIAVRWRSLQVGFIYSIFVLLVESIYECNVPITFMAQLVHKKIPYLPSHNEWNIVVI